MMNQTIFSTFSKEDRQIADLVFWYKTEHVATGTRLRVEQCRNCELYTYILPFCIACSEKRGLLVRTSSIPGAGNGVFACKRQDMGDRIRSKLIFSQGSRVCSYGTEQNRIVLATALSRYGSISTQPYTYETEDGRYYDSADYRTIGAIINDIRGTSHKYNVEFRERSGEVCVAAIVNIYEGDELFLSYGDEYWKSVSSSKYTTASERPEWCTV